MESTEITAVHPMLSSGGADRSAMTSALASLGDVPERARKLRTGLVGGLLGLAVFIATLGFLETRSEFLSWERSTQLAVSAAVAISYALALYNASLSRRRVPAAGERGVRTTRALSASWN